jgi:hypothetical protein
MAIFWTMLYQLMLNWRTHRENMLPDSRALHPPTIPLGSPLLAVLRGHPDRVSTPGGFTRRAANRQWSLRSDCARLGH